MKTTFNTQALAYSVSGTVRSGQTERTDTQQLFKKLEVVKKDDAPPAAAQAAVVSISAEGAQRSAASQAAAPAGATEPAAAPPAAPANVAAAPPPASPAPDSPVAAASASVSGGSVSNSVQTFDPADDNRDGKVTDPERQAYDARLAAQKAAEQAAEKAAQAARAGEADAALKAYGQIETLGASRNSAA